LVAHRLLGIPFSVSTFVDFDYVTPFHMLPEKFGSARFVVTCTGYCAERLRTRLPELASRLRVLHHALPANYASAPVFRADEGPPRLVYVGRFVAKKGIDTLVRACAFLRDWSVPFSCHLYGAGEGREGLESLVDELGLNDRVKFEGAIPNERFYSTMTRGDLFVCPCRYMDDGERDGIPVTFLETMAAGITVVTTPVSGIPELVTDGYNGFLVPPDDPRALAERLRGLLRDEDLRASVGEAAKRTIQEGFTIERSIDRLDSWISRENGSAAGNAVQVTAPIHDGA
jgi:glycosyltransferase involved in cell wall biosynthesis